MNYLLIILSVFSVYSQNKNNSIYKTELLEIRSIAKNTYLHISYINTKDWGKVPSNGMLVIDSKEAIIFDTPVDSGASLELIKWIEEKLECKINSIIVTHFHKDALGGLKVFHENNIPSYANTLTIDLAKQVNYELPLNSFSNFKRFKIGNVFAFAEYFGEGHTKDNIIGYFPSQNVMHGGCLIKSIGAGKGNLEDANVSEWSTTVTKLKMKYPLVKHVIPGHGKVGDKELLNYTIKKFKTK